MRYTAATLLAFASAVLAQSIAKGDNPTPGFAVLTSPARDEKVPAGSTYEIVWSDAGAHPGSVAVELFGGKTSGGLEYQETIATVDVTENGYSWDVPSSAFAVYGLKVVSVTNNTVWQWGNPFSISGGSTSSSTSKSGSASATASATETESSTISSTKSASATTTSISETSSKASSTIKLVTSSTIRGNLSTSATGAPETIITSTVLQTRPTTTSTSTSTIPTGAAATVAGSSFALLGGVAMAILAL